MQNLLEMKIPHPAPCRFESSRNVRVDEQHLMEATLKRSTGRGPTDANLFNHAPEALSMEGARPMEPNRFHVATGPIALVFIETILGIQLVVL